MFAFLMCLLTVSLPAADDVSAVLKRADEVLRDAPRLACSFRIRREENGQVALERTGRALIRPATADAPFEGIFDAREPDATEDRWKMVVSGWRFEVLDRKERVLRTASRFGTGLALQREVLPGLTSVFSSPKRFQDLAGYGVKREADATIGEEPCDVVSIRFPSGGWRWHFSKESGWLRREEQWSTGENPELRILELAEHRAVEETGAFEALELPEGFERQSFQPAGPAIGELVSIPLLSTEGGSLDPKSWQGKVVVLDFWATWCVPCRKAMPGLQALSAELAGRGLQVVGLTWNETADPAPVAKSLGVAYPIASGQELAEAFGVETYGIPALWILDREGRVFDLMVGYHGEPGEEWLRARLLDALGE